MTKIMRVDATGREVSRTKKTVMAYRARYPRLFQKAGVEPDDYPGVVNWFVTQDGQWAAATISQYRAALQQAIDDGVAALTKEDLEYLVARLGEGPSARKRGTPRTSARKRKSLPFDELTVLVRTLNEGNHPDDRLAANFIAHNCLLFLRPVEWETAVVRTEYLIIQNAKATNGRGLGRERRRDLRDYGAKGLKHLSKLLVTLSGRAAAAGGYGPLWARLASRIARTCKSLKIRRVALYTTRHVGMANAKSWMSPEELAASAGHRSTATATSHYAKRRHGWGPKVVRVARASKEDIEKVIRSPKESREKNLAARAEKRREREAQEERTATATSHYASRHGRGPQLVPVARPSKEDTEKVSRPPKESREKNLTAHVETRAEREAQEERTATATSHYAKRRHGRGPQLVPVARPSKEDTEKVIRPPKESREKNLTAHAEKHAEREAEEEMTIPSFKM
jgi:hypothetical protein